MKSIELTTYKELQNFLDKWNSGSLLDNILVVADGGLGKSYHTKTYTNIIRLDGHVTPFRAFLLIAQNPDKNIIFDDMDSIFNNQEMIKLLKQCCELNNPKKVHFRTTAGGKGSVEVTDFNGYNLVILNSLKEAKKNLKALLTRFLILRFKPSKETIFAYLESYAKDKEILTELKKVLESLTFFNLRFYEHIKRLKDAKMDWKGFLYAHVHYKLAEIVRLIEKYPTDKERAKHFDGCEKSYYTWKKKLTTES